MAYSWPVTAADVRAQLNEADTTDDAELAGYIDAATEEIEALIGTVTATSITDQFVTDVNNPWPYHYGTWPRYTYNGARTVDLRSRPVQSVQSVVVSSIDGTNAVTLATSSYRLDTVLGNITVVDSSAFGPLVTVTYTAGRATVPAGVRLAALLLVQHLWEQTQRGGGNALPLTENPADLPYTTDKMTQAMALLSRYLPAATVA